MDNQFLKIDNISAVLWGTSSDKLFVAVHGDQSHKTDNAIVIFAKEAAKKGFQTLSFDLPEHGGRKEEPRLCNAQNCVEDLKKMMEHARAVSDEISLFGCGIGAYFGMLAFNDMPLRQAVFLSPVVDMKRIIQNIMVWFDVSEERLRKEREILTSVKTLYWDYYQYILEHQVQWTTPTVLLYGKRDNICEFDYVKNFAEHCRADMTVLENGEHFFDTGMQLAYFRQWLQDKLISQA